MSFSCVKAVVFDVCLIARNGECLKDGMACYHDVSCHGCQTPAGHSLHILTLVSFVTMNDHPLIKTIQSKSEICLFISSDNSRIFECGAWFVLSAEYMQDSSSSLDATVN